MVKMSNLKFAEVIKEHFPLLVQYTPVLVRVHGDAHPELAQVLEIFEKINAKVQETGVDAVDLSTEFEELRKVTGNYSIPSDGCETYAATYQMLGEADEAYHG